MRVILILFFTFVSHPFWGATWVEMINQHRNVLSDNSILPHQQHAFSSHEAPTIVDPRIKSIPIIESGEDVIDIKAANCARISMMPSPAFPFEGPVFHSGLPQASKMRRGVFTKLLSMVRELDSLASYFGYEPGQIDIKVFEGLRDLTTQKMLFERKVDEICSTLHLSREEAESEASKWVSPYKNNVPVHSTGAAVDIRLWNNHTGSFLDLGSFGVIWGKNEHAPTFSEGIPDKQKQNRLYCLIAAERAGLTNYLFEHWHFSSGDRYSSYWHIQEGRLRQAVYGPIQ